MSVFTHRRVLLAVAALLLATAAFASHPSARTYPRMAFDPNAGHAVLFGGESMFDTGTQLTYDSDETWLWSGSRWTQVFPANTPPGRAGHTMVYDSARDRVVMFGGRRARPTPDGAITLLNDTWVWQHGNWTQIATPNAPEPRHLSGAAYDAIRDRVVLFGGSRLNADGETFAASYDTWEFDGTTWTKVNVATEPKANVPVLAYDAARNQTVLVGVNDTIAAQMFVYEPASQSWRQLTPEKLPDCVNESAMTYRAQNRTIVLIGGVCSLTTPTADETWVWNGTTWAKAEVANVSRATGQALTYDPLRDAIVAFGGNLAFSTIPNAFTTTFSNNTWRLQFTETRPSPRSLGTFRTDPVKNTLWLFGGLNEFGSSYIPDLWGYRNGQWFPFTGENSPGECAAPLSAYDLKRSKLVLTCGASTIYEFDGAKWELKDPEDFPSPRRFSGMVYDENIGKVVLFGGYDGNYRNDTWTWDGTNWTEVERNRPTHRGTMAMWYDPLMKRTVIYGGLGRENINRRITRYTDMWSFDGTGWRKIEVSNTPGERFGAQLGVNPESGKVLLFGGLRAEIIDEEDDRRRQFFDNDTWEWDGSARTWTRLEPGRAPRARQNGYMTWDPVARELVLFGGYAGFYYSDTWAWNGTSWKPRVDTLGRTRSAGGRAPVAQPPNFDIPRGD